jgi:hypothetical protein
MPKHHIIIEDVQVYDFIIEIPDGLTEEQLEDHIWDHLGEHRDECWRSGEETIIANDKLP